MMLYAIVSTDGSAVDRVGLLVDLFPNVSFPAAGPEPVWLAENRVLPVVDDPIPDYKVATSGTLERDGDVVRRIWSLEDAPPQVVLSVLPVALRRALRATPSPSGEGHALAYVLAALSSPGYEAECDAFEYMVRALRADLLALGSALGFDVPQIDAVLALAATYPGSDAVMGPAE